MSVVSSREKRRFEIPAEYPDAITAAGGIPLLLPPLRGKADLPEALAACRGMVLSGGLDYDPQYWGEPVHAKTDLLDPRRDAFDLRLVRALVKRGIPVLGICAGCQLLNIGLGGTLHQDIFSSAEFRDPLRHNQKSKRMVHWVEVAQGSLLAEITHTTMLHTNSSHHQAVWKLGRGLRVVGRSSDGCIEAIAGKRAEQFLLGVQWHPERSIDVEAHLNLFKALVRAARNEGKPASGRKRRKGS